LPWSQAIDSFVFAGHHLSVSKAKFSLSNKQPQVVGSFGSLLDLEKSTSCAVTSSCDIAEIRLDILHAEKNFPKSEAWSHLPGIPLLFTARRSDEGGALSIDAETRMSLLRAAMDHTALIDIEVASISEMANLIGELKEKDIPWIASYHDFKKLPSIAALKHAAQKAKEAGAAAFKVAAMLGTPSDIARLADFQLDDHGLLVSTMGMGPLAPVSRLLCAQSGSVLNYGYIGESPTAPGQWDSALLKLAISRLSMI
jgi:3-dehydroquinate dehydratase I